MDGMMNRTIADAVTDQIRRAAEDREDALDEELKRMDDLERNDVDELDRMRERRLEQMKKNNKKKREFAAIGHGKYTEILDQKDFFDVAKTSNRACVHFYRDSTWRCKIIDKHLEVIAQKHFNCRFVKINAEKSQYLCQKLRILMLPCVVLVKDGATAHCFVGFDEFGDDDEFPTELMEERLAAWDMINIDGEKKLSEWK